MKKRYIKRKYKLQEGINYLNTGEFTNPDYQEAYDIRTKQQERTGRSKEAIGVGADLIGSVYGLPPGAVSGTLGAYDDIMSAYTKDKYGNYRNKEMEIVDTLGNPLNTVGYIGTALTGSKEDRQQAKADLWSGSYGALGQKKLFGINNPLANEKIFGKKNFLRQEKMKVFGKELKNPFNTTKNPFGKTTTEKVKDAAVKEEIATDKENAMRWYNVGAQSSTEGQSSLAKRGKYKVKTKQPRLIETEGREPIFSPKKPDGTRDLLYYNPNDPTHEEGGVKAVVMPRAQAGKQSVKSKTKSENTKDKDSWFENFVEIIDPFGVTSSDDAYRSIKNVKNNPSTEATIDAALESAGALPLVKKAKLIGKLKRSFEAGKFAGRGKGAITDILGGILSDEGYNKIKGTYKGRNILPQYYNKETAGMGAPAFQAGTSKIMSGRKHYEIPEIKPPTPYELMPKPPRSRFNKDSKKIKVYR